MSTVWAFGVGSFLSASVGADGFSGLELGSFGSVPFSASSLSVKPSPSVSLVAGSSGELGSLTVTLTGTSSLEPSG